MLVGVALLRVTIVWLTREDVLFRVPYLDAAFYRFWAQSLATGGGDFADAYFLGPLYPHFLSLLHRLGLTDPLSVRWVQTGMGILDVGLVLLLGRRLQASSTGVFAALLLGLYGTVFFYEGILVMESLLTTLVLAACVLLWMPAGSRWMRLLQVAGAGLLLGLATTGRGTILLLLPVAVVVLRSASARAALDARLGIAVLLLAWGMALVPVLRHNAARGAPFTLTTNAGVNFFAGNNADSRGRFRPPPGVAFFTTPVTAGDSQHLPPAVAQRRLTTEAVAGTAEAADSAAWIGRSLAWMRQEPLAFVMLTLRKCGLVLQGREIGQIESPAFHRRRLPVLQVFPVGWSVVLPLAVLGLLAGWRREPQRNDVRILGGLILALLLPCIVFFVTARYRLVAVPFACVLAGMGLTFLVAAWRSGRTTFGRSVALVAVFAALTRVGAQPAASAAGWENAQMAERHYADGDLDAAIRFQETAARLLPERAGIRLNLALYWSERGAPGDLQRAEETVRALVQEHPRDAILVFNWASLLAQRGEVERARALYRRVLELDPDFELARRNLRALGVAGAHSREESPEETP